MNVEALRKDIDQIARELTASGDIAERRYLELRTDIDRIKLELMAIRQFMDENLPEFTNRFPKILKDTIEQINPESD